MIGFTEACHRTLWFVTKPNVVFTWRKEAAATLRGATGIKTRGNRLAAYDREILEAQLLKPNSLDGRSFFVRCSGVNQTKPLMPL